MTKSLNEAIKSLSPEIQMFINNRHKEIREKYLAMLKTKLDRLLKYYEIDTDRFIEQYSLDSVVPAICMNEDCNNIDNMEPDQGEGYCEECHTNTVVSGLILIEELHE